MKFLLISLFFQFLCIAKLFDIMTNFREYKLLNLLEFNSSRKRMSVIVSDENGQIFLLCKGADK